MHCEYFLLLKNKQTKINHLSLSIAKQSSEELLKYLVVSSFVEDKLNIFVPL